MQGVLFAATAIELTDNCLDVLTAITAGDQYGIGRFDDDEIFNADQADQSAGGMDQGVAAIGGEPITKVGIARCIFR